jgi:DNA-binding response OmpR family regulator
MGTIALLEDNHDTAELIQAILGDEHEVQWFPLAKSFLESFQRRPFDLILLDVSLPDTDGYVVYTLIRAQNPKVPVIVISAHAQPDAIRAAIDMGACEYITKPILDLERFRGAIRRNLRILGSG